MKFNTHMSHSLINNYHELFENIFKNELLDYYIWVTWHSGKEEEIKWKNPDIIKIIEANEELNNFIKELLQTAISFADQTGGSYGLYSTINNNKFGFSISSGFTPDMIDELDPEGYADSHVFYTDDFINKLKSISSFKSITKNNLSDFINFKISEGQTYYFKLFDQVKNNWVDSDQSDIGEEIEALINDIFYDHIYSEDEFNIVNDRIFFSHDKISYFTEEQITIQDREFINLSSVLEHM